MRLASHKLPIHTKFITRAEQQAAAQGGANENAEV
jgi:ribosomal protein L16/L10AE